MTNPSQKYTIIEAHGRLALPDLNIILGKLPVSFQFSDEETDTRDTYETHQKGVMEVYHSALVISLFPENGKRLSCATFTDWDFPIRPDNIMDDTIGLRCCYHPKLASFGLEHLSDEFFDHVEIDIHKFPKQSRDRRYVKFN